jgi:tellurite resistance protein TerC
VRLLRRVFPVTTELRGAKFFTRENGRLYITPLLVALVFLEATDIVFAVDSVPAIFAFTKEPLIVFTSNIFAILGLRALYFMLAGAVEKFYLLRYGLGAVLVFVGLKMAWFNSYFDGGFPIVVSLAVIGVMIGLSIALSLLFPRSSTTEMPMDDFQSEKRPTHTQRRSTIRVLRKVIALYLLLLGAGLILGAAFNYSW